MTSVSVFDTQMMSRAIQLARKGLYTTRPNPCVGCVWFKTVRLLVRVITKWLVKDMLR